MLAFLHLGRRIDHASSVFLIGAILLAATSGKLVLLAGIMLALAEKYWAWRVALDAELFDLLRRCPERLAEFDAALAICAGRRHAPPARALESRWLGARRLLCRQAAAFGLQAACLIAPLAL